MDVEYYRDLTRYQFENRKVILAGAPLAAYTPAISRLKENFGAVDLFLLAAGVGSGEYPSPDDARWVVLDTKAETMIGSFRIMERLLHNPPREVREELDRWDPGRDAVLLPSSFFYRDSIAGRRAYGWRRPEWLALEDKVLVDEIWDAAGVERAPFSVVEVDRDTVERVAARLDRGAGAVLSGDARDGFNGGAEYVRWVGGPDDLTEPMAFFGAHCDWVRIMPFLEGIPCSIHGFVFPDTTVALRPCELMTLRRPERGLKYCGAASYWDPPDADRESMRRIARLVGEHLRRRVDYRGAFTVDGVLTEDGFLPTELNTRAGAAVGTLLSGVPGFALGAVNRALIEGEPLDYRPDEFERLIVETADAHRGGGGWTVVDRATDADESVLLTHDDDRALTIAGDEEESVASLSYGPGEQGGFVRFVPRSESTPVGPSLAPTVASAFAVASSIWGVDIGDLAPAPSVRPTPPV